jgi:hypothetical protein
MYDNDPDKKLVEMGKDIAGNGQPDLVISEWTEGLHCCLKFDIFEIGSDFRKIGTIDEGSADAGPHFVIGHGPGLEVDAPDWTFAYWNTAFATSPAPGVILRYRNGRFRVATDEMRQAPPTPAALDSKGEGNQ